MKEEATLTPAEIKIMQLSRDDPDYFTDYFFRPLGGTRGFRFDENFDDQGKWQKIVHSAEQRDIVIIGGFGTGKTLGIGMSAAVWCATTADFKFLNVAEKAWQSKQMYDMILLNARNTRFDDLIWERPRKPHPKLVIRFKIGNIVYESSMEFLSVDKDATGVLSWEGDWLHIDEAGLLDNLEEIIINAGSRLRGTVRGRERLGRFSMTSNSWDNFHLWYYFDQALTDPDNFLSLIVSSRHNHNVTEAQLRRMLSRIPEDERERFIDGTRPEGKGTYFSKEAIYDCEYRFGIELVEQAIANKVKGYELEKLHGAGVIKWEIPKQEMRMYMLLGDPGTGAAPHRNSPVLMVWDVTDFPSAPANLVAFWWGNGNGKIGPWIRKLFTLWRKYLPMFIGMDSTGPQKNMAYLMNEYLVKEEQKDTDLSGMVKGISGLDFSGPKKVTYLQAGRLMIESRLMTWPKEISGIRSQLANYEYEDDKKIAQDLVATFCMAAHSMRLWFHVSTDEYLKRNAQMDSEPVGQDRRRPPTQRSQRSSTARTARHTSG